MKFQRYGTTHAHTMGRGPDNAAVIHWEGSRREVSRLLGHSSTNITPTKLRIAANCRPGN
ncbi:hypothetical protein [Staphylococcus aureus]|uniref:hypothetical protein n=1 Tax=Staphylococcus aureus TaxID=1280 RepID=UPI0012D9757B|nr:hypothetical protein [Staphylococcus aureus]MUG08239.1 hypothetical protein [Staphylococcus aureus]MUG12745.1 hypothetical protein [Staphylococcus aureus]MUH20744.1 hypothetical protein [Staphylococcus aureus]